MRRRNPDDRLRDLERRAAQGDRAAHDALEHERHRHGCPHWSDFLIHGEPCSYPLCRARGVLASMPPDVRAVYEAAREAVPDAEERDYRVMASHQRQARRPHWIVGDNAASGPAKPLLRYDDDGSWHIMHVPWTDYDPLDVVDPVVAATREWSKLGRRSNPDERGRRRERAARHDDTPAGQAAVLVERMRRGELDPNRLLIGALLGDPVARLALPGWHRTGRSVSNLEDARSSGDLQYFLALPLNALDVIEYGDVHQVKIDPGGADWWPEAWQIATALFVDVMGDTARSVLRQRWRDEILSRSVRASDIHDLEFALRNAGQPPSQAQIRWVYYHALIDALYPWARGEA